MISKDRGRPVHILGSRQNFNFQQTPNIRLGLSQKNKQAKMFLLRDLRSSLWELGDLTKNLQVFLEELLLQEDFHFQLLISLVSTM